MVYGGYSLPLDEDGECKDCTTYDTCKKFNEGKECMCEGCGHYGSTGNY